jgi:fucose permease
MRDVSPDGKYSRNLSFGQFIKAIGSLSGSLVPLIAIRHNSDWRILFPIYSIAVFITVIYVFLTPIKEKEKGTSQPATFSSSFRVLSNPYILLMVIGIFLYVGAEVSMSAKLPNFLEEKLNFDIKQMGLFGTLFFFLSLMTGRFLGGVILNWLNPKKFLVITAIVALLGIGGLYISNTVILAFVSIAIIGLGFANVFPLIFSITVDTFPEKTNEISGLMVTAIVGGAFVPVIFGVVADIFSLMAGFLVPAICMLYILFLSSKTFSKK